MSCWDPSVVVLILLLVSWEKIQFYQCIEEKFNLHIWVAPSNAGMRKVRVNGTNSSLSVVILYNIRDDVGLLIHDCIARS